jgi:hypothetical protein
MGLDKFKRRGTDLGDDTINIQYNEINIIKVKPLEVKKTWKDHFNNFRSHTKKFLDSAFIQTFMTTVTLYALLGDDFRVMYANPQFDDTFTNLTIASLFFFSIELILSCFGIDGYFNSFFFYLDLVSTASIIADIQPIMDLFT